MLHYSGAVYRPPSEAHSLIIQVTVGCSHNKCAFCNMYKAKQFSITPMEQVLEDLRWARAQYPRVERFFLADGDALILPTAQLLEILGDIRELFPECRRISTYASPKSILKKSPEDLSVLRAAGLDFAYLGLESGNDALLKKINKGVTAAADRGRAEAESRGTHPVRHGDQWPGRVQRGLAGPRGGHRRGPQCHAAGLYRAADATHLHRHAHGGVDHQRGAGDAGPHGADPGDETVFGAYRLPRRHVPIQPRQQLSGSGRDFESGSGTAHR